jgi:uncharacterized membrane protein YgcG
MSLNVQRLPPLLLLLVAAVATALCCSGCHRYCHSCHCLSQRSLPLCVAAVATAIVTLVIACRSTLVIACRSLSLLVAAVAFLSFKGLRVEASALGRCLGFRGMDPGPPEAGQTMYYYVESCPRIESCNPGHWKKSKVWAWTEEGCRGQLKIHLMNCGKHLMPADEAELVAAEPELETENYQAPPEAPHPKRQRPGNQQNVVGRGQLAIPGGSSGSGGSSSGGFVSIKRETLVSAF